jgi:hypothetical protein
VVRLHGAITADYWLSLSIRNHKDPWSGSFVIGTCSHLGNYLFILLILPSFNCKRFTISCKATSSICPLIPLSVVCDSFPDWPFPLN